MRDLLPQHLDVTWAIVITTPLFLLFFVLLIFWVYGRNRRAIYRQVENLPLEDEKNFK